MTPKPVAKWDRKQLADARSRAREATAPAADAGVATLLVGMGSCGLAAGARSTLEALRTELQKTGLVGVVVKPTGCVGMCFAEPTVEVRVPGMPTVLYGPVDASTAQRIVREHVMEKRLVSGPVLDRGFREIGTGGK